MEKELEELGLKAIGGNRYWLSVKDELEIEVINNKVYLIEDDSEIFLFYYDYEKLKQLIKLLS